MFGKVLIANRGAIACRVIRTLRRMSIGSVAVYSEADCHSLHVSAADSAVCLGGAPAAESYLRQDKLIEAAHAAGAEAVHPGYGFLSENAVFAEACEDAGLVFIGPTPEQIRDFGLKHRARELAARHRLPLLPGSVLLENIGHALIEAHRIGYPVMLKSTAGGGGIGMQLCGNDDELTDAYTSVERLASNNFSDSGLFLEKYIERARHIEVQLFGDGAGHVIALGERDCSMQRRNQKVIEETPAPNLSAATREKLLNAAVRLGSAVNYRSAGTVEFVYDVRTGEFYFLEVNTRLQVEHGVTEEVTGIDLVEWMIRVAAGEPPDLGAYHHQPRGHSIQVRLYAEDPARNFMPSSGLLAHVSLPEGARVDGWIETGTEVSAFYDPLLAKIIVQAATREDALEKLSTALGQAEVYGVETNLAYLRRVVREPEFAAGRPYTRFLSTLTWQPLSIEVLQPGTHTTIQDYPGREGYWNVGVPPSGPMDHLAFRLANRIVGNAENAAALELTGTGPTLKFAAPAVIALSGAHMKAALDGVAVRYWEPVLVGAGAVLRLSAIQAAGQRTYLAVKGGFDVPLYMGSRATFTLGQFGGNAGRALRVGDVLRLNESSTNLNGCAAVPAALIPQYDTHWDIAVIYGPHGAPDFFTADDIRVFFDTAWEVHYNSSRTGVRLIGPKPQWARADGGEAGLHPSNIHDNAYAIGSIDYTGDMPVILGPDGPSLGGFVCPATIVHADLWKTGQLRPGDTLRFHSISIDEAVARRAEQDQIIQQLSDAAVREGNRKLTITRATVQRARHELPAAAPLVRCIEPAPETPAVSYRQAGENYLLIEYGPLVLDLELRFRVHALMTWLEARALEGIIDLTPGIRSLQVHYDSCRLSQGMLLDLLQAAEQELPPVEDIEVPSRIVHLPLSWDDPATQLAVEKYMQSVRSDAPWCPSNIEFIRRINGLDSLEDVRRIVFEASYLVMGLGDVYLGAPVATPLDPRHRLVTTKYNPARTWTPENAVGIGGAYLCVYGMEGPGGYQFVGRTVQMWNRYRQTADFNGGKQWLLRFFDQIRFYPVTAQQLLRMRQDFPLGRFRLEVAHTTLKLRDYHRFLRANAGSIAAFKARQQAAFEAERERWNQLKPTADEADTADAQRSVGENVELPQGCIPVCSPVTGSVWQVGVAVGQRVAAGQELMVVEAMKMEIPLTAGEAAEVVEVRCSRGRTVFSGEALLVLRPL